MISIKNGYLCKAYSTCNSNMTEYIPFRLHIQRRGYKLRTSIHINMYSLQLILQSKFKCGWIKFVEVSDPVPVRMLSMVEIIKRLHFVYT